MLFVGWLVVVLNVFFAKLWGVLGEDMFEFLICREVALQLLGEFLGGDLVVGYAYGGG